MLMVNGVRNNFCRHVQKIVGDTFEAYLEDLSKLGHFLELCRKADPEGIYHMEVDSLLNSKGDVNYKVYDNAEKPVNPTIFERFPLLDKLKNWRHIPVFRSLHIFPSCTMHFWKCSRKFVSADAAHLRGQFDGIVNFLTC